MKIMTTLKRIEACRPCQSMWHELLTGLGKTAPDDEPLPLETVLDIVGIYDAIWCLRACDRDEGRLLLFARVCKEHARYLRLYNLDASYDPSFYVDNNDTYCTGIDAVADYFSDVDIIVSRYDEERAWLTDEFRRFCRGEEQYA